MDYGTYQAWAGAMGIPPSQQSAVWSSYPDLATLQGPTNGALGYEREGAWAPSTWAVLNNVFHSYERGGANSAIVGGLTAGLPVAPTPSQVISEIYSQALKFNPALAKQALSTAQTVQPGYTTLNQQQIEAERALNLQNLYATAPWLQAIRAKSEMPQTTQMRSTLLSGILDELKMGSSLTPQQSLQANDSVRSAEMARGFTNGGQPSANREAVSRTLEGLNLLGARQQKASAALSQEYAASPNPFTTIPGLGTQASSAAAQTTANTINQVPVSFLGDAYWKAYGNQVDQFKYVTGVNQALETKQALPISN